MDRIKSSPEKLLLQITEDSWKTEKKPKRFEENYKDKEIGPNEVKYNCHNIVLEI